MSHETSKKKTIGVVAPGRMGAAIAQKLNDSNIFASLLTVTEGRSQDTILRARNAGLVSSPSLQDLVASVDIFISVLPPSDAVALATEVASLAASRKGVAAFTYIEANAISPETTRQIAQLFDGNDSLVFIDGSIVGGPPSGDYSPAVYLSGKGEAPHVVVEVFEGSGLVFKALDGGIGAASALKMSYAMMTKGFIALAATSVLGAAQNNVLPDLLNELSISQPRSLGTISGAAGTLGLKSYRWIGEMLEIASYLQEAGNPEGEDVFKGIARVYERADREKEGEDARTLQKAARLAKELIDKESESK